MIDNAAIFVNWVFPIYDPIEYRANDSKLQYASKTYKMHYAGYNNVTEFYTLNIAQTEIIIFNSLLFDSSTFKYYDFGTHFLSYKPNFNSSSFSAKMATRTLS